MKRLLVTALFTLVTFVVLSGAAPNNGTQPPLEHFAHDLLAWVSLW